VQTKRDQVQAHLTLVGRLGAAMVAGEPDLPQAPMRRGTVAAVAGTVLALLGVAGFVVWGLLSPGGATKWKADGTLIVEKETSARYAFLDGVLHPVLNYASARLILGSKFHLDSVSQKSLRGVPRGAPVGIPGAPETLPPAKAMTAAHWLVCDLLVDGPSGPPQALTVLDIGAAPPTRPIAADRAALVGTGDGTSYLLWHGTRLRVANRSALVALGYGDAAVPLASPRWINAVPAGPDLRAADIPHRGEPGPTVDGHPSVVGQVFVVSAPSAGSTYFVLLADGLAAADPTAAALLLGDPGSAAAYPGQNAHAIPLSGVGATTLPASPQPPPALRSNARPGVPPMLVDTARSTLCTSFNFAGTSAQGTLVTADPQAVATNAMRTGAGAAAAAADAVAVTPGTGVLAAAVTDTGADTHASFLVTDLGVKYPLPTPEVAQALGYQGVRQYPIPVSILALLPTGPVLDAQAATATHGLTPG
jgi:type VII secretion protein EccB